MEKKSHLYSSSFFFFLPLSHFLIVIQCVTIILVCHKNVFLSVVLYMYVFVGFVGWCVYYCVSFTLSLSVCCLHLEWRSPCCPFSPVHSTHTAEETQLNCNLTKYLKERLLAQTIDTTCQTVSRGQGYFMIKQWCWSVYLLTGGSGGWTPDPALRSRHPPSPLLQRYGKYHQHRLMIVRWRCAYWDMWKKTC